MLYEFNNKKEAVNKLLENIGMLRFSLLHEKDNYLFHPKGKDDCLRVRSAFNKHMGLDWGSWKRHELPKDTPDFLVEVLIDGH